MILRPYQRRLVERAEAALKKHGDTLAVAATGAGKSIILAALGGQFDGQKLVVQHRQELVGQNMQKWLKVNPGTRASLYTADAKSWRGDAIFGMAQTLAKNLERMPALSMVILDEAHHAAAPTWRAIVARAREVNPDVMVAGFTATPERGDRRSLRAIFSNVADQITIRELVQLGFLVAPRAFVVDVAGTSEKLKALGQVSDFGEQVEVEKILNTGAVNAEVVRHWREKAGDRRSIVFCSTVQHAQDVAEAFKAGGARAECVHGGMANAQRQAILRAFDRGEIQVLTNVMVLTEGFDCQPTAAVVLLRKCSGKGPLVQMVGRGLRTVNAEEYPGVVKKDCVVLDFGTSLLTHGDLNMEAVLLEREEKELEEATRFCPTKPEEAPGYAVPDSAGRVGCGAELPSRTKTCPLCGFTFEREKADEDGPPSVAVELTELDILNASPFRYVDLFGSGRAMIASGFQAWAGVFSADGETWSALGKVKEEKSVHPLALGERLQCMCSADDFLREHETDGSIKKSQRWLDAPASPAQLQLLNRFGYAMDPGLGGLAMTKYAASCHAQFQFDRRHIERAMGVR